ncbi:MAG: PorT family protein [Bacteroidota bacterium]|nr:PorT family protein [Bacteroidota bacterium]
MKKYILSIAVLIAISVSAKAQFSLGIKGGVNYSTINTDNLRSSSVAGYQVGAFARLGGGIYLQPELYLSSTGGKFNSNDNQYSGDVKFTNLNVPVLLGFRFGPKNLNLRVMGGPIYTSVLSSNQNFSANFNTAYADFGHYKSSTIGFQAGAGVDLGSITADLRYEGGLNDINSSYGQRQKLWALSIGFKIF